MTNQSKELLAFMTFGKTFTALQFVCGHCNAKHTTDIHQAVPDGKVEIARIVAESAMRLMEESGWRYAQGFGCVCPVCIRLVSKIKERVEENGT